jgi:LexA-binding, inner membrane-associated putative hydrolase
MAGFRMHVTTSALLGCGYAGVGHAVYGVPLDTAIVAGAMCGFSGMLPDLDSDYGVPLRETMAFTAAIVPMLLVGRFQSLELTHDAMVLVAVSLYLFVRFGITNIVRKYTVHRGMFHSIPAGLIFTGLAFIVTGAAPFEFRCYKAGGVLAGFLSHLVLDEIYAVEWKSGQWRFKKSFGTALKFWGDDGWANFSTYAKLMIVAMMILGEPTVLERIDARHPGFAQQYQQFQNQIGTLDQLPTPQSVVEAAQTAVAPPGYGAPSTPWPPATTFQDYDTAQRPGPPFPQ